MNLYEKEHHQLLMHQKVLGGFPLQLDQMSFDMKQIMAHQQQHPQPPQEQCQRLIMQQGQHRERKPKLPVEQHEHWVALVWTESNKYSIRSSPSMKFCRSNVLSDGIPRFTQFVQAVNNGGLGFDDGVMYNTSSSSSSKTSSTASKEPRSRPNKRKKATTEDDEDEFIQPASFQTRDDEQNENRPGDVHYRADATEDWAKWFYSAFRAVQQTSCRVIAKEWIKTIHPKKQSTHPYNGKNPKTGEKGDPSSTKPPYWPEDVIHKEPDHINKEMRTKLLVHLLMKTPLQEMSISGEPKSEKEITAEMLKEPLDQKKLESQNKDLKKRYHIVEQIIEVRTRLEQYEYGGIGGDTIISAPDYSDYNRGTKDESEEFEADELFETPDAEKADDDETEVRTELAPDDTDYVLLSRQPPSHSHRRVRQQTLDMSHTVPAHHRLDGRPVSSRSSSFTSAHMTPHQIHPQQHREPVEHPPMIGGDWQPFRTSPSVPLGPLGPPNTSPNQVLSPNQMWRHPMQPFSEHSMISNHPMTIGPQGPTMDGRYVPVPQHGFVSGPLPMHQYARPHEYHPEMGDPNTTQIRAATPHEYYMHPPPSGDQCDRPYFM